MAADYEMRVSDAEREAAAAELREHFASGRLDQQELDQRLSAVFAARTRGDLNALFTDLPSSGPGASGPRRSGASAGASTSGPRADWRDQAWAGYRSARSGYGWGASAGRRARRLALAALAVPALFALGILGVVGVFGIGAGRPFGVVLIIAAFALLRKLVFIILGRGRRGRSPRGRRGGCGRRYW